MTENEIKILMTMGYRKTQEEGAILEHPKLAGMEKFVWNDDHFMNTIKLYTKRIISSERKKIARSIGAC